MSRNRHPGLNASPGLENQIKNLLELDCHWSRKFSIYNRDNSISYQIRPALKFLEFTGHGIPWLLYGVAMIYTTEGETKVFFWKLMIGLILDLIVVAILKLVVKRPRPSYNEKDMNLTLAIDDFAFPSGHTTRVFMVFLLYCFFNVTITTKVFMFLWAVTVAISRVVLGRHHISDVFCGVWIGLFQAVFVLAYVPLISSSQIFYLT